MAKSKAGGTRAYIRGKIGADVYSIGKDGKGRKQQVVRSLAEQVKNPRTTAQMRGRMIMSTIMHVVAAGSQLFDHSFDNVPTGQPSLSEFIRTNYALIKADVAAHESVGNTFGLNKYQEKDVKVGAYQIASGTAQLPSALSFFDTYNGAIIATEAMTAKGVRDALGLGIDDYITLVEISEDYGLFYLRIRVDYNTLSDATVITAQNAASLFILEGNYTPVFAVEGTNLTIALEQRGVTASIGAIISKKSGAIYEHNDAIMTGDTGASYSASVALPTYPTGSERFLNGGEI